MTSLTISDTERREVARKLRAARGPSLMVLLGVLGVGGAHLFDRLADLIEPSCDRDALLELVKELELGAQCFVGRKWPDVECERMAKHLADDYEMSARRIREACGEEGR